MARANRGPFKKNQIYIVVAEFRASATEMVPLGMEVPNEKFPFKAGHLRALHRRRRIGIKGSPWANEMLARAGYDEESVVEEPVVEESVVEEPVVEESVVEESVVEESVVEEPEQEAPKQKFKKKAPKKKR